MTWMGICFIFCGYRGMRYPVISTKCGARVEKSLSSGVEISPCALLSRNDNVVGGWNDVTLRP